MDFYKLARIGAKAHWEKQNNPLKEYIKNTSLKFLMEKARIVGFIMGDGYISKLGKPTSLQHHDICFYPDDKNMLDIFLSDFEKVYLKKPFKKELKNHFLARVSCKPACDDLRTFGDYDSLNWELPKKFSSKEQKREWIRALFDCESYVGKNTINFQSVSKKGIESMKDTLQEFGISCNLYQYDRKHKGWNLNHILVISKKENLLKYEDLIGFNHTKKKQKLHEICQRARMVIGTVSKTVPSRASRFNS